MYMVPLQTPFCRTAAWRQRITSHREIQPAAGSCRPKTGMSALVHKPGAQDPKTMARNHVSGKAVANEIPWPLGLASTTAGAAPGCEGDSGFPWPLGLASTTAGAAPGCEEEEIT